MGRRLFFEDVDIGDSLPTLDFQFTPQAIHTLVRIWTPERGPTHFDSEEIAHQMGFRRPIVPSHLSMAYLSHVVLAWSDNVQLKRIDVICRQVLFDDDRVTCKGVVVDKVADNGEPLVYVDLYMENEGGERPLTGSARVLLPYRPQV
ncbi:MAG: hypothetical protein EXR60_02460 [Dehalococcoidia bacterium]|nr:hypothetical protein [Dehalococcoidia bacterium]